jgi:hypothetical protein
MPPNRKYLSAASANGDEDDQQVLRAHQKHHRSGRKENQSAILAHMGGEARAARPKKNKDRKRQERHLV